MSADLKINISADASQAITAIKSTTVELNNAAPAALRAGQAFDKAAFDAAALAASMGNYVDRTKAVAPAVLQATAAIEAEVVAQTELNTVTAAANTSTNNFINTNAKAKIAFLDVGRVITGQGFSLRSLASNFSLLGPEVVIAAAAVGYLAKALFSQTDAEKEQKAATDALIAKNNELRKSVTDAIGTAQTQGEEVRTLAAIITNANEPYEKRQRAIDELKKINKSYFGDLTIEKGLYGDLQKKVEDYTNALVLTNVQKARGDNLTKANIELADYQDQLATLNKLIAKRQDYIKLNFDDLKSRGLGDLAGVNSANDLIARDSKILALGAQRIALYEKVGQATNDAAIAAIKYDNAVKAALSEPLIKPPIEKKDTSEADLTKQITAINKEIAALEELQKQGIATKADIQELFKLKIDKIDLELPRSGFTAEQATALKDKLEDDAFKAFSATPLLINLGRPIFRATQFNAFTGNDILPKDSKGNEIELPVGSITFDATKALKSAIDAGKGMGLVLRKGLADGVGKIDITDQMNALIKTDLINGLDDLGVAIGDAVSGGGLATVLHSVENSVGGFIEDFGKLLVKSGVEMLNIKAGLKALSLSPAFSIAAGVAAVAIGEIIKNASKGPKATPFAEGGIVTGPTYALIGEAGTEVVFPLSKLNKYMKQLSPGGGSQQVYGQLTGRLQGADIYLSAQVESQKRSRFR